jgi:hypothetical protein
MTRLHKFLFLGAINKPAAIVIFNDYCLDPINLCILQKYMKGRFPMVAFQNLFPSACGWCVALGYNPPAKI